MKDVDASEAEQLLDQLLDEVERGETVRIMRDGKPIARLTPEADARRAEASEAIKALRAAGTGGQSAARRGAGDDTRRS